MILTLSIILILGAFAYLKYTNSLKRSSSNSKKYINEWMTMSNQRRNELYEEYNINTMIRKKKLLKDIRREFSKRTKYIKNK